MSTESFPAPRPSRWTRSYPPLALLVVAAVTAAFILPSSLNLPQSNPSTVLEYAPVPPEDDEPPPPSDGNASALGLGSSNSLTTPIATPPPPPPPPDEGDAKQIRDKNCIGDRQTEDPTSPPCVAFFDGDNFGATYQGVSRKVIKVLIYLDAGCTNSECPPDNGRLVDLQQPARPHCPQSYPVAGSNCDYLPFRIARAFRNYFNSHFQTYDRTVHYYAFITSASSAATRKKDAADLWARLKPFAVIDQATFNGFNQEFDKAMASRGVLVFTQETALPASFYREAQSRAWGFWPDIEHWSAQYVNYVCTQVKDRNVFRYGNPPYSAAPNGQPRRFGLYYTTDAAEPGLIEFREQVKTGLRRCGVDWVAEGTFPTSGFVIKGSDAGTQQQEAVQKFISEDVTTVLWLGGIEGQFTKHANNLGYFPEIVLAGDLDGDNNVTGRHQNRNVWKNAWATSFHPRLGHPAETIGYRAYVEGDSTASMDEARYANLDYRDHFMLFTAIQVAGPRLNPVTVDKGFHAIPERRSSDPFIPALFFDPGDYSAVKDSTIVWWDPDGVPPGGADTGGTNASGGTSGCYRMVGGGLRYQAHEWAGAGDPFVNGTNDPCTAYEGARRIDPT